MKKQLPFLLLLTLMGAFVFSLEGCHDKCEGSIKTSAEFKTYNELYYFDKENGKTVEKTKIVEEDTFMLGSVTFEALEQNAESYEWTIGTDPKKRTSKKFSLNFNDFGVIGENPLPVKLRLKKTPNTDCFPTDKGIDSVSHFIYFLPTNKWPVYGRYLGFDDTNPTEKYVINIFPGFKNGYFMTDSLKNLPNNCSRLPLGFRSGTAFEFTIYKTELIFNNKLFQTPNCVFREYDKHIGYLKSDRKSIVIEYEFTDKYQRNEVLQHRIFTGKRVI